MKEMSTLDRSHALAQFVGPGSKKLLQSMFKDLKEIKKILIEEMKEFAFF